MVYSDTHINAVRCTYAHTHTRTHTTLPVNHFRIPCSFFVLHRLQEEVGILVLCYLSPDQHDGPLPCFVGLELIWGHLTVGKGRAVMGGDTPTPPRMA